ncbi:MAG TPA: hypothetical protein V6C76_02890 [Drouetiella sp.]
MRRNNLVPLNTNRSKASDAQINPNALDDLFDNVDYSGSSTFDLAREIIGNYKVRVQNVRMDFLQDMTRESLNFLAGQKMNDRRKMSMDEMVEASMKSVVDEVFTVLEPYISEFNKAVARTQLTVSTTSPAVVKEVLSFDSLRRPIQTVSSYRCRISTCRFSVAVRGQQNKVEFYLLPVEHVLLLTNIEAHHRPLMTFSGEDSGIGMIDWQVEGKPLTADRLERYILHMFDYLIEKTRDELAAESNQYYMAGAV